MKRFIVVLGTFFLLGLAVTGVVFGAPAPPGQSRVMSPESKVMPGQLRTHGTSWHRALRTAPEGLGTTTATATPTCPPNWSVVPNPALDLVDSELYGVDAASSSDLWGVGIYFSETLGVEGQGAKTEGARPGRQQLIAPHRDHTRPADRPEGFSAPLALINHWNGSAWTVITDTNLAYEQSVLASVDEVAANDAWAVGYYVNELGVAQTLVDRWDGSHWSQVPSANSSVLTDNQLFSIQAVAADDVWAVGTYANDEGVFQTLVEHWDGTSWSIVPSPNVGQYDNVLYDLAVVSADDIWAVGFNINSSLSGYRALSMRWNGTSWSVVPNPGVGSNSNNFYAVDALAANDVWVVGSFYGRGGLRVLIEHWDGTQWNVVPGARLDADYSELYAIDAVSSGDIWTVGSYTEYNSGYYEEALTEHWNGTAWTAVESARPPQSYRDALFGVAGLAANEAWAVGAYRSSSSPSFGYQALVERYSTDCIPLNCTISFTDVHPEDYYYYPVLYLYCRGAVSGYGDNTFRPGNNTTRAQLAKILVLAEGWDLQFPFQQHFVDVFPWDPFYQYVETAYAHGIISGYSCTVPAGTPTPPFPTATPFPPTATLALPVPPPTGTPGAACLEFRPGNNITRAQLCKVVVLSQGWTIYTPPTPTFQDVPADNPFYQYVETAYYHNIISGYGDGTFRPGNNATRGQIAKIIFSAVTQP